MVRHEFHCGIQALEQVQRRFLRGPVALGIRPCSRDGGRKAVRPLAPFPMQIRSHRREVRRDCRHQDAAELRILAIGQQRFDGTFAIEQPLQRRQPLHRHAAARERLLGDRLGIARRQQGGKLTADRVPRVRPEGEPHRAHEQLRRPETDMLDGLPCIASSAEAPTQRLESSLRRCRAEGGGRLV